MLGRHLPGVAIADTPDFGPKPWISLGTVIWRMGPILVHLSWGYRAGINQIPVCVDSRCGAQPVSNPPVCTTPYTGREPPDLARLGGLDTGYTIRPAASPGYPRTGGRGGQIFI